MESQLKSAIQNAYRFGAFGIKIPIVKSKEQTNMLKVVEETPKVKKPRKRKDSTIVNEVISTFFNEMRIMSERSQVSCGIRDFDPVSDTFEDCLLDMSGDEDKPKLNEEQYKMFKEILMNDFTTLLKKHCNHHKNYPWAFYNISLNSFANKDLIEILDKNCYLNTEWRKNPNSGNMIKVWLF